MKPALLIDPPEDWAHFSNWSSAKSLIWPEPRLSIVGLDIAAMDRLQIIIESMKRRSRLLQNQDLAQYQL